MSHTQERYRDEENLNEQIKITIREIFDLDSNIEKDSLTLKQKIQRLAEQYEELYNLHGNPEQISEICSQISRMFEKTDKPHLRNYVTEVLPSKFKRVKIEDSTSHLTSSQSDVPEECIIAFEQMKEFANQLNNPKFGLLTRDNIRELWDKSITAADNFQKICTEFNISLIKGKDQNPLDDIKDAADKDAGDKVKEEKPLSKMSPEEIAKLPHVLAVDKVINDFVAIRRALIEYPIELDDPLIGDIENSFDALHLDLQHSSDKKYRRTLLQWGDILYEAGEQGGTSAASHSGVQCAGLTDQKTGQPLFRNITKEQIDAIKLPMYNKMNFIIHNLPKMGKCLVDIDDHMRRYEEQWRERRCELLSPKLQKKA